MTISETIETTELEPKPRRAHRRTKPIEADGLADVAAPALQEPPAPLLSAAGTRRANEVRRLNLEIERADANTAATVLRMRCNYAQPAEVLRVEAQMNQSTDEKRTRLARVEALTGR